MTDLLLTDNDLTMADGDLVLVTGLDETLQALNIALTTGLGEWTFDTTAGVAYRGGWRARPIDNAMIQADVKRVCLGVRGVTKVESIDIVTDNATRSVTVTVMVTTVYGTLEVTV